MNLEEWGLKPEELYMNPHLETLFCNSINASHHVTVASTPELSEDIKELIHEEVIAALQETGRFESYKVPTDMSLKAGEVLVVKVETGRMPKENIYRYLEGIRRTFEEKGLTKVIFSAQSYGEGIVGFEKIDVSDSIIE